MHAHGEQNGRRNMNAFTHVTRVTVWVEYSQLTSRTSSAKRSSSRCIGDDCDVGVELEHAGGQLQVHCAAQCLLARMKKITGLRYRLCVLTRTLCRMSAFPSPTATKRMRCEVRDVTGIEDVNAKEEEEEEEEEEEAAPWRA